MATSSTAIPMFSGEYRHALDEKNRLTIPSRWRTEEVDEFFIIKSPKRACLTVMPRAVFIRIGEDAKAQTTPTLHRRFVNQFYAQAKSCPIDKQGRLLLPDDQCQAAGLRGETVLTGSLDRFDLWSPANWQTTQDTDRPTYEDVGDLIGL